MSDLISRQDAIEAVTRAIWHYPNECYKNLNVYEVAEALVGDAIKSLPSAVCDDCIWHTCNYNKVDWDADVVSKGVFDQVKLERDTALKTLEEHGIGFGERAEPKTEMVLCALADRACPFQGKEYAWCLTCPHISEEDRELVQKAVGRPTGRWINKDSSVLGITYECSNCGRDCVSAVSYDIKGNEWRYNYCPNCGCAMEGGDADD